MKCKNRKKINASIYETKREIRKIEKELLYLIVLFAAGYRNHKKCLMEKKGIKQ